MKKLIVSVLIGVLVFGCLLLVQRSCVSDKALAQAKLDYATLQGEKTAANAALEAAKADAFKVIAAKEDEIAQSKASIVAKDARIATLQADLAALQGDEPPTTPDIEALPIVINLRAQVSRLTAMFTLAQAGNDDRDRVIGSQQTIIDAKGEIVLALTKQLDNEHTLRVAAEGLFKKAEHSAKLNKLWKPAAFIAGAVALGAIVKK